MTVKIDGYTLDAICQYVNENYPQFLEVQVGNIVSTRVEDSFIVTLIDCGIKGIPKFRIPIDKLEFILVPISEPEPKVILPEAQGGEIALETARKTPIEVEYIDLEEEKPKPKMKVQAVNGRRKRGKK